MESAGKKEDWTDKKYTEPVISLLKAKGLVG